MRGRLLLVLAGLVVAALAAAYFAGAEQGTDGVTVEALYALLTTEDGRNRLEVIEEMLADIDLEVDLIHSVAQRMLEDQYGFFQTEKWTLDDIKFQLDLLENALQRIQDRTDCIPCP